MSELFSAFGIDGRLLLINCINFGLLLAVLWYFLYGPLTKMLEARRQKIAQGMQDAEEAETKLKEIHGARASMIAEAGKEADTLVADARAAAAAKARDLVASGETAAANLLKQAEAQAQEMKAQSIAESKQEVAKLIVLGMERLAKK
ncbi:ATP synthase F0 subunit B [Candidatus Adlerbacteria bacterium RIFOXYC1_FULL_48_26]|uniref:ATP synthase subunit b n=1 Tax=Candidatus Adlerbacteria bacterium RIFOXYC1_FULL_48_26 TaxID=1797247 RepID=A0A1F4Y5C1_9BACT|nr:MAG: ATP synthase F0 subunit B [Candidatus Adlerbacteria bacterium RIFOXYC1_FULL_48_26]OGC93827.1 MAG: ATP synthase F0 subunit B [Candidatus Adlerbacteria bacterium RIFOXYB1_FULL_48_10]OGC96416.1 MAG: ATP synthase F0 subunit B [Candidatus Adlerbacteria bacterium RIFOXYD1_FULL_48_8]